MILASSVCLAAHCLRPGKLSWRKRRPSLGVAPCNAVAMPYWKASQALASSTDATGHPLLKSPFPGWHQHSLAASRTHLDCNFSSPSPFPCSADHRCRDRDRGRDSSSSLFPSDHHRLVPLVRYRHRYRCDRYRSKCPSHCWRRRNSNRLPRAVCGICNRLHKRHISRILETEDAHTNLYCSFGPSLHCRRHLPPNGFWVHDCHRCLVPLQAHLEVVM